MDITVSFMMAEMSPKTMSVDSECTIQSIIDDYCVAPSLFCYDQITLPTSGDSKALIMVCNSMVLSNTARLRDYDISSPATFTCSFTSIALS